MTTASISSRTTATTTTTTSTSKPLSRTSSASSDAYFEDYDDPAFLEALANTVLPGDLPPAHIRIPPASSPATTPSVESASLVGKRKASIELQGADDDEGEREKRLYKRVRVSNGNENEIGDVLEEVSVSVSLSSVPTEMTRRARGLQGLFDSSLVPSPSSPSLKRPRPRSHSPSHDQEHDADLTNEDRDNEDDEHEHDDANDPLVSILSKDRHKPIDKDNLDIYGHAHFGNFGEYMARKRAKLQIQNLDQDADYGAGTGIGNGGRTGIFKGLAIYINGYTNPSIQDLRLMILKHGGTFHAYLDRKSLVTHIITNELTPAKAKDWKRMKIVRPEWIVESVQQDKLLSWRDFAFRFGEGNGAGQRTLGHASVVESRSHRGASLGGGIAGKNGEERGIGRAQMTLRGFVHRDEQQNRVSSRNRAEEREREHELVPDSDEDASLVLDFPPPPPVSLSKSHSSSHSHSPVPPPITDPIKELTSQSHSHPYSGSNPNPYASKEGNAAASKAMQDPNWRAQHTSSGNASEFIEGFYKHSRLHYLSTWKVELQGVVARAREAASSSSLNEEDMDGVGVHSGLVRGGKGNGGDGEGGEEERVIMHCDFDCFFVAAGLVDRPHLKGKPVVVCHSQTKPTNTSDDTQTNDDGKGKESSTSEIASASYEARKFGIKNGMSLRQARNLCKDVVTIPYEFEKYKEFSLKFYTILMKYADRLEAVSVDEALIDVTRSVSRIRAQLQLEDDEELSFSGQHQEFDDMHPAKRLAERIRDDVRQTTQCEVSIGISSNPLLARLATRRAKPANSYLLLSPLLIQSYLSSCDITDVRGFGYQTAKKVREKFGTSRLGELEGKSRGELCKVLGKVTGETLYDAIRGVDKTRLKEGGRVRKSVSCDITYGIRFESDSQVQVFILDLAREVSKRMKAAGVLGRGLTVKVLKRGQDAPVEAPKFLGHGICDTFTKQVSLPRLTDDPGAIGEMSWKVIEDFKITARDLRGVGIQVTKLEPVSSQGSTMGKELSEGRVEKGQARLSFKPLPKDQKDQGRVKEKQRQRQQEQEQEQWQEQESISSKAKGKQKAIESIVVEDSSQEVYQAPPPSPPVEVPLIDQFQEDPFVNYEDDHLAAAGSSIRPNSFAGPSTRPIVQTPNTRPQSFATTGFSSKRPTPLPSNEFDLPSLSQVDMSVFNDLPDDVRKELEDEYKKRSLAATKPPSPPPQPTSLSSLPSHASPKAKKSYSNFKGIAKQFGARGQPSVFSQRPGIFGSKTGMWATGKSVRITDEELRKLNIDPEVFRCLPASLQREQLSLTRFVKERGTEALKPFTDVTRIEIRPDKREGNRKGGKRDRKGRRPNPKAVYPTDPPVLKQHGKNHGEKISYSSTVDVQGVIEKWVDRYKAYVPGDKDVDYFSKFLVQCLDVERSTDTGMEKAIECMQWWLVLLRRNWREWERAGDPDIGMQRHEVDRRGKKVYTQECIGRSWWAAFREVKRRMDGVVSERFGGQLII